MIRMYALGGIFGAVFGLYLGSFIDILVCYGIILAIGKIVKILFKKIITLDISFLLFSILYWCVKLILLVYLYNVSNNSDLELINKLAVSIGAYFVAVSLYMLKKMRTDESSIENKNFDSSQQVSNSTENK